MKAKYLLGFLFLSFLVFSGCARSPVYESSKAMRPLSSKPVEEDLLDLAEKDDAGWESLVVGLETQIRYWEGRPLDEVVAFGPRQIRAQDYLQALRLLREKAGVGKKEFFEHLAASFELYQVYGGGAWGQVLVTGYYEPVIRGSRRPTKEFSQPLYKVPPDLVNVDMAAYAKSFPHWSPFETWVSEQKSPPGLVRGRFVKGGENEISKIIPYYSREEIDSGAKLKNQKLELVYVDPVEAFFLHIQGSGQVELGKNDRLRVGYAAQNGHPYVPIGKYLKEDIPIEKMSLQSIESHMRDKMNAQERQRLMNKNPSFVFFSPLKGKAVTYSGTEVVDGRTIATDWRMFPKGTLAWLKFQKPKAGASGEFELEEAQRLVFDQDTGGAIRGSHRVDLFCGQGDEAKKMAGVMRHHGELIYLVPKEPKSK